VTVVWQALIAGVLGGFVGLAELVSRYRSAPGWVLKHSPAAWVYILINVGAGVTALLVVHALGWTFGQTEHVVFWQILIAGFGAIAFFRSSLFVAKVGGSSVGVGPSLVLGSLLDACDREVDRQSAEKISTVMNDEALEGLDPDSVMYSLPVLCLALMQNFPTSEQAQLGAELAGIRNDDNMSQSAKVQAIVVQLSKYLSDGVVREVLKNGRAAFVTPSPAPSPTVASSEALIDQTKKIIGGQPAS
jgi:hypothetical protein